MDNASRISDHFDKISPVYDDWKKKNWYYYDRLKNLIRAHVPENSRVLEIGCGTGDILASVNPKTGVGIDISRGMIEIASSKYSRSPNLSFYVSGSKEAGISAGFDYIMLVDVVEHAPDMEKLAGEIKGFSSPHTKIFISMGNPVWEPVFMLFEKLRLKMPEGEHYRISYKALMRVMEAKGFTAKKHGFTLLVPGHIPGISRIVNSLFDKLGILKKLGMIEYIVLEQK